MAWRYTAPLAALTLLARCGPAPTDAQEPTPPPLLLPADDAGTDAAADASPPDAVPLEVGPLPGPPGADPPGFEAFEPLPEGCGLTRALWKIEGALTADQLREGVGKALSGVDTCLATASSGGRLPLHLIIEASGRVVELGAPLAESGMRAAITCAQESLRMLRFPEAASDTTVRLIVER
jgi:hypothetical protein